jgi:branched-chain amino acid transport system ATP-binding protein
LLELQNATTGYGKFCVLKGVSIRVEAGEIVCIVGANGAGKTTIMRSISGIIPLWNGTKLFQSMDVTRLSSVTLTRKGIIQIPEGRLVIRDLTVEDNLRLGAYAHYYKLNKSELSQDLEQVYQLFPRLQDRFNQRAGTLSGGEQQMLAIGRGLMGRPKLLMLDEPSLGLAPLLVRDMFNTIRELHQKGLPILLVEQNVKAALQISNRGYVLETGEVVIEGNSSELLGDEKVRKAYLGA